MRANPVSSDVVSRRTAEHYTWGAGSDGWFLLKGAGLHVIEERMPAGAAEKPHWHERATQLFYVLRGSLTMRVGADTTVVHVHEGVVVEPGTEHQARNDGHGPVEFLVISSPPSHGDRIDVTD
jgi:mannose-6-phosphate isomerase-like protein (cupin superfamily)